MIRVVTVIGHGLDLLPHFLKHYDFADEIHIIAYNSDISPNIDKDITKIIDGIEKVSIVNVIRDRVFDWKEVTNLYNNHKSQYPDDWWIVADVDEFQLYPNNSINFVIKKCEKNGWNLVRGGFIDRIADDGEFAEIRTTPDLFSQYPNAGFFRYPMSKACPNKVSIMRGYVKITSGQHYAEFDGHTTWRWQGWNHPLIAPHESISVQVHHFKWDSTAIERIKNVANIKQEYSCSDEYRVMYQQLRNSGFKIDITNPEYMFEKCVTPQFDGYTQWNKLIKKIISI